MKMACGYITSNIGTAVEDELSSGSSVSVSYVQAWEELFVELSESVTDDALRSEVVPTIKSLVDLKHKVAVRKHGVRLLVQT